MLEDQMIPVHSAKDSESQRYPWRSAEFPTEIACKALLYPDEVGYLHWVGSEAVSRGGAIVDLGAFLGGSSLSLAQGSQRNSSLEPRIYAYDLFRVTEAQIQACNVPGAVGDSYLDHYKANLHEHLDRITTYEGYIPAWIADSVGLSEVYPVGDPVSVLFIDCAKQWGVHHTILRVFGPYLTTGSVVVQQDFRCVMVYLALHMYQLRDVLEPAHFPEGGTVGFVAKGPISQESLDVLWTPEDVDGLGRFSVLKEVADWFDSLGHERLSPWIWLAGAGEGAWSVDEVFISQCIEKASAGLNAVREHHHDLERMENQRENWNGEVRRLVLSLKASGFDTLAQTALDCLQWNSDDESGKQVECSADSEFIKIWHDIEQVCLAKGWNRIALYCNGRHTLKLLASGWPSCSGIRVVAIFDDQAGRTGYSLAGVPVVLPTRAEEFAPDVILPSSDVYESEVWSACQRTADRVNAQSIRVYSQE